MLSRSILFFTLTFCLVVSPSPATCQPPPPPVKRTTTAPPKPAVKAVSQTSQAKQDLEKLNLGERPQLILDPQGAQGYVYDIDFSWPSGEQLAIAAGKEVRILDSSNGRVLQTLRGERDNTMYGETLSVAFSPDGNDLLVGIHSETDEGSIRVYSTKDYTQIKSLTGQSAPIRQLAFSRSGKTLAAVSADGEIILWDWPQKRQRLKIPPRTSVNTVYSFVSFPTDDENCLLVGYSSGPEIIDSYTGKKKTAQDNLPAVLNEWMNSYYGQKFVFKSGLLPNCWDFSLSQGSWIGSYQASNPTGFGVGVWKTGQQAAEDNYAKHSWYISAVDISPDGSKCASADQAGEVHIWNQKTQTQLAINKPYGNKLYDVQLKFEEGLPRISYSSQPYKGDRWGLNSFGACDQEISFSEALMMRFLDFAVVSNEETTNREQTSVTSEKDAENRFISMKTGGSQIGRYQVRKNVLPSLISLPPQSYFDPSVSVMLGDGEGALALLDMKREREKVIYLGHDSMISGVSYPDASNVFATSSTDCTIKIWPLKIPPLQGGWDFLHENGRVTKLKPSTSSTKAGVKVGDKIVSFDGLTMTDLQKLRIYGEYKYQPGQEVLVVMDRDGKNYSYSLTLVEDAPWVDPLVSIFVHKDQWIAWSPTGFYCCSPGADRFVGWHVNQGPSKSADFFQLKQYQEIFYRPDVISRIIETGSEEEGIQFAESTAKSSVKSLGGDLRNSEQFELAKPPSVTAALVAVSDDQTAKIECIVSAANLPVTSLDVIVDGIRVNGPEVDLDPGETKTIEVSVPLTKKNEVAQIVARNDQLESKPEVVQLPKKSTTSREPKPSLHALIIGCHEYSIKELGLPAVKNDVDKFREALALHKEGELYSDVTLTECIGTKATLADIKRAMDRIDEIATDNDVVLVYVGAHSDFDAKTQEYYIAPYDFDGVSYRASALKWDDVITWLDSLPRCTRIVLLDTCYSGAATRVKTASRATPENRLANDRHGVILIASSASDQVSRTNKADNRFGAFTYSMLKLISSPDYEIDKDKIFGLNEIEYHLQSLVRTATDNKQVPIVVKPEHFDSTRGIFQLVEGLSLKSDAKP